MSSRFCWKKILVYWCILCIFSVTYFILRMNGLKCSYANIADQVTFLRKKLVAQQSMSNILYPKSFYKLCMLTYKSAKQRDINQQLTGLQRPKPEILNFFQILNFCTRIILFITPVLLYVLLYLVYKAFISYVLIILKTLMFIFFTFNFFFALAGISINSQMSYYSVLHLISQKACIYLLWYYQLVKCAKTAWYDHCY